MYEILLALTLMQPADKPAPVSAPVLKMDAQVNAQPGAVFVVKAETNLRYRKWNIPAGLVRVPPELTKLGEDAFVGYGPAGVYEFGLSGTFQDQFAEAKCIVFVGNPGPPPTPNPGPKPPAPEPGDPLVADLQKAFEADGRRADVRNRLVRLWQDAAAAVSENDDYKTLADFREAMHTASSKYPYKIADKDLEAARLKLGEQLKALCNGSEACPLGAAGSSLRQKVRTLLESYAAALGAAK